MRSAPIDLRQAMIRLGDTGSVDAVPRDFGDLDLAGWTVAVIRVERETDAHPDVWEVHPEGDEVTAVLSGGARVSLRTDDGGEEELAALGPGELCVVPAGRWHRLDVDLPSELLAVTRVTGTRLEPGQRS